MLVLCFNNKSVQSLAEHAPSRLRFAHMSQNHHSLAEHVLSSLRCMLNSLFLPSVAEHREAEQLLA